MKGTNHGKIIIYSYGGRSQLHELYLKMYVLHQVQAKLTPTDPIHAQHRVSSLTETETRQYIHAALS